MNPLTMFMVVFGASMLGCIPFLAGDFMSRRSWREIWDNTLLPFLGMGLIFAVILASLICLLRN